MRDRQREPAGRPAVPPVRGPEAAGLITAHAHTPAATAFAGRPVPVGPGPAWTLRPSREGGEVADRDAPVGPASHVPDGEGRLTGPFRVVM